MKDYKEFKIDMVGYKNLIKWILTVTKEAIFFIIYRIQIVCIQV